MEDEKIIFGADSNKALSIYCEADNKITIKGQSLIDSSDTCYDELLEWMQASSGQLNSGFTLSIALELFNTYSTKLILDVLLLAESYACDGVSVQVKWMYAVDDEDMKEAGEEFADIVDVPFSLVPCSAL